MNRAVNIMYTNLLDTGSYLSNYSCHQSYDFKGIELRFEFNSYIGPIELTTTVEYRDFFWSYSMQKKMNYRPIYTIGSDKPIGFF